MYFDIDSTYRNRNDSPNPADFSVMRPQNHSCHMSLYEAKDMCSKETIIFPEFSTPPLAFYYETLVAPTTTIGEINERTNLPFMFQTDDPLVVQLDEFILASTDPSTSNISLNALYPRSVIPLGQAGEFYTGDVLENFNTNEYRVITSFFYQDTIVDNVYQTSRILWATTIANSFQIGVEASSSTTIPLSNIDRFYQGKYMKMTSGAAAGDKRLITNYSIINSNLDVFTLQSEFSVIPSAGDTFQIVSDRKWFATIDRPFSTSIPQYPSYRDPLPVNLLQFSSNIIHSASNALSTVHIVQEPVGLGVGILQSNGTNNSDSLSLGDIMYIKSSDDSGSFWEPISAVVSNTPLIGGFGMTTTTTDINPTITYMTSSATRDLVPVTQNVSYSTPSPMATAGYYKFDDSLDLGKDSSVFGRNATINDITQIIEYDRIGARFNTTSSYMNLSDYISSIQDNLYFNTEFFIKPNMIPTNKANILYIESPSSSNFMRLAYLQNNFSDDVIMFLVTSDNEYIVFLTTSRYLYSMKMDGSDVILLGTDVLETSTPIISPDNTRVIFQQNIIADNIQTTIISSTIADGKQIVYFSTIVLSVSEIPILVSNDSSTLVFYISNYLYSIPIIGGTLIPLYFGTVNSFDISDNSSKVVYLISSAIYSVPIGGGTTVLLSNSVLSVYESFKISSDSSKVVYHIIFTYLDGFNTVTEGRLYSVPIGGGSSTQLNVSAQYSEVFSYDISSNNLYVIYISNETSRSELYSVSISGGAVTKLNSLVGSENIISFSISNNSTRVVYISNESSIRDLYSVPITGGTITKLNSTLSAGKNVTSFQISQDSTRVIYVADQDTNDIFELYYSLIAGGGNIKISGTMLAGDGISSFLLSDSNNIVLYKTSPLEELYLTDATVSSAIVTKLSDNPDIQSYTITNNDIFIYMWSNKIYSAQMSQGDIILPKD